MWTREGHHKMASSSCQKCWAGEMKQVFEEQSNSKTGLAYVYFRLYREMAPNLLHHHTVGIVLPTVREMGKIHYVKAFMSLHNKDSAKKGNNLMMQRRELASKPLLIVKTQEEKENEDMSLFNALNPGEPELAAGRFPSHHPFC
ncbi:hypothetical protein QTO34_003074 [Cnephaeus nilssonii]|uniref:Uncharacterized protein n=1 Tax=Cnephaeus nilssonii TaxID=3371016 RepID=A0AA40HTG1_CNENI|nr:hypothetical protein QTO34_003074 [Eptesicus nilssonii]